MKATICAMIFCIAIGFANCSRWNPLLRRLEKVLKEEELADRHVAQNRRTRWWDEDPYSDSYYYYEDGEDYPDSGPDPTPAPSQTTAPKCGTTVNIKDDGQEHEKSDVKIPILPDCGENKYGTKREEEDIVSLLRRILSKKHHRSKRVVGGMTSEDGRWPWMAGLLEGPPGQREHVCGGALISDRWVLTAAHCIKPDRVDLCNYHVQLGENKLLEETSDLQIIGVDRIIKHIDHFPGDNGDKYDLHDIMLMRLKQRANLAGPETGVICLPAANEIFKRDSCYVAGWGINVAITDQEIDQGKGSTPKRLQHLKIPVLSDQECKSSYVPGWEKEMLCLKSMAGKDICSGDSGGPLVCKGDNTNKWLHVGVASFGANGCAKDNSPSVYISTREHLDWIEKVVRRYGGA